MTANHKDNIIERLYAKGILEVVSPLIVGSGNDERAEIELIRDWSGTPFIPGTAIAGAARNYLDTIFSTDASVETLFGRKVRQDRDTMQSLISFYDVIPRGKLKIAIRDGIALDNVTKTAKKGEKYDYEIIERGQQFDFRLEVLFRECHNGYRDKMKDILFALLTALKDGQIAFGAKTRRGFGMVKLIDEKVLTLNIANSTDDVKRWIDFSWNEQAASWHDPEKSYALIQLRQGQIEPSLPDIANMTVIFDIPYSILIRHYGSDPQDPDTSHLTSLYPLEDGQLKPFSIIPGTSWNGALRHAIYHILRDLNQSKAGIEAITNDLFGYVDETKKEARASRVLVRESRIDGGEQLAYTRNKVDRFTGGVVDSALFDEKPHYGGKVTLHISVKHAEDWEIGLLLLAIKDIGNGIQPVGGAANIGRGILELQHLSISNEDEKKYLTALAAYLQGGQ